MSVKTAWGEQVVSIGTPGTGDIMATTLADIGLIKEESISFEKADGTKLELFSTGHNLVDSLRTEPIITLKMTLIGITDSARQMFWKTTTALGRTTVKSLVNSTKYSVKLASKVVGADTLEAPYCEVSMGPLFAEKEGFTAEVAFTFLRGATGDLFYMDVVPA
jgi:hypothetical protein